MYDIDLVKLNRSLVKAVRLAVACRKMIGPRGDGCNEILDLEREIRAGAAECQRVLELVEADADRPLISGEKSVKG